MESIDLPPPYMSDTWTLLIVDDCAEDRKIYRRYLLKDPHQSYRILEADAAETGLALYQQMQCHVILLDFCLPDMSGLDFLDKLKQQASELPVSAIMMTGHGDQEVAVQAMKRGVEDYLVKQHLTPDVMQLAVRNAIAKSSLQARLSKTQERQRLIATTALRIRQSLNLEEILQTVVAEVRQLLKCESVMVHQFDPNQGGKTVASSVGSCKTTVPCDRFQEDGDKNPRYYQTAIARVWEASFSHDQPYLLEQLNERENLVAPIILPNNGKPNPELWGLLIAHQCSQERRWQPDEVEALNEMSVQLAIAIQQAELLAQTQAALVKEKQLNAFKSQIIATISHEYRTPLATILAGASTLKQHGDKLDKSKQQRFLQIIEEKARHMSKLVDDMLVVNQFELDKTKFKPVPIDLPQFFFELIEEQRAIASDRHEVIFKTSGNREGFWGDRGLLRQIFFNLISNAIKYSPEGGKVEFHLTGKKSQIIFYVKDEGIGIPNQEQEKLFKSFSRASNVGTIPGTGLGLAIAKACVELHGGNITLSSQVGKGTKVTVTLPKKSSQELIGFQSKN